MKIALIGYGKMGKMIEQIALSRGHEIVSIIDIDNQQDFNSPAFASADVAIEFTAPQAAYGNYLKAWEKGVKIVSGSTGWMKEHGDEVRKACTEEGKTLFWASNFSIGVAIFSAVNKYLAKIMNQFPQYDVEIDIGLETYLPVAKEYKVLAFAISLVFPFGGVGLRSPLPLVVLCPA